MGFGAWSSNHKTARLRKKLGIDRYNYRFFGVMVIEEDDRYLSAQSHFRRRDVPRHCNAFQVSLVAGGKLDSGAYLYTDEHIRRVDGAVLCLSLGVVRLFISLLL